MSRVDDPYHYLDRAFEYYIAGRFTALNNLQVAANLFHHAVEMLAKFRLLRSVPADGLAEQIKNSSASRMVMIFMHCGRISRLLWTAPVLIGSTRWSPT